MPLGRTTYQIRQCYDSSLRLQPDNILYKATKCGITTAYIDKPNSISITAMPTTINFGDGPIGTTTSIPLNIKISALGPTNVVTSITTNGVLRDASTIMMDKVGEGAGLLSLQLGPQSQPLDGTEFMRQLPVGTITDTYNVTLRGPSALTPITTGVHSANITFNVKII